MSAHDELPKVWPWLTERRAFIGVAIIGAIGVVLRLGGVS